MSLIIYEKKDNVAWLSLNRPDVLNAQNDALTTELYTVLEQARDDNEVHVVVITGTGDKAFSAGADIGMMSVWNPIDVINTFKGKQRYTELIREIPKPVIAMVNGFALGGGCELAMACDIIIASNNARFGLPEINVGLIPGGGGTQALPRLIGEKRAKEMVFTGDIISADDAYHLGLVNKVVPKEQLRQVTEELIAKLKAKSPAILKIAKLAVNKSLETPLSVGIGCELDLFATCFGTNDQKEGTKAFIEKRKPVFKGN